MSAQSVALAIRDLSQQLAASVRDGTALVSDARQIVSLTKEARGWLITVENELDPARPAP